MSWPGEDKLVPGAIPKRLVAHAAVLWAMAVKECAEEAKAKSDEATAETLREIRRMKATEADAEYLIDHLPEGAF
jgi:hypothetical protein